MQLLKNILTYLLWALLAFFLGIVYVRLLIGDLPTEESYGGFGFLIRVFFTHGILLVGSQIGGIIALLFIGIDIFFLKKKLRNNPTKQVIRLGTLLGITAFVALVHYLLEKVIDII